MLAAVIFSMIQGAILEVGPGRPYTRIEDALKTAQPGAVIRVWPSPDGYAKTALLFTKANIRLECAPDSKVVLDGTGFDYSGAGAVPRAIIQFEPTATNCSVNGFTLKGAYNSSHNGAGVRINGAADVTIKDCNIEGNDMGIMSNGSNATHQQIEHCHIHHNGSAEDPGYNHNLYLGGADVSLKKCEIDHALTGHDLKSRAHFTMVEDSFFHDSANREFDFVEAEETAKKNSNAVILNCLILKVNNGGNGNVIHFGHEKGVRDGGIWLIGNTITTTSSAPILMLSDSHASATVSLNVIACKGQAQPTLLALLNDAKPTAIGGHDDNWISPEFGATSLRDQKQSPLPGTFWRDFVVAGPSTKASSEYGDGGIGRCFTGLGYGGLAPWK